MVRERGRLCLEYVRVVNQIEVELCTLSAIEWTCGPQTHDDDVLWH